MRGQDVAGMMQAAVSALASLDRVADKPVEDCMAFIADLPYFKVSSVSRLKAFIYLASIGGLHFAHLSVPCQKPAS